MIRKRKEDVRWTNGGTTLAIYYTLDSTRAPAPIARWLTLSRSLILFPSIILLLSVLHILAFFTMFSTPSE